MQLYQSRFNTVFNKVSLEPNIVKRHEISEILIWEPNVATII